MRENKCSPSNKIEGLNILVLLLGEVSGLLNTTTHKTSSSQDWRKKIPVFTAVAGLSPVFRESIFGVFLPRDS